MRLRTLTTGFCGILALLLCAGCARQRPRVLRLALPEGRAALWQAAAEQWATLAGDDVNGRVLIQALPESAAADLQLRAVRDGLSADCALLPASALAREDPAFHVFALPWLFPDADTAARVCEGPMGEAMLKRLNGLGLVGLAYASNGFRQLATRSKVVRRPADLSGLAIWVPPNPGYASHADALRALGARPLRRLDQPDGWEWAVTDLSASASPGDLRGLTLWNAAYEPLVVVINKSVWESLTELERGLVRMTAQDAVETQRRLANQAQDRLARDLEAQGVAVIRLRLAERAAFERAAAPAIGRWTQTIGPDLVRKFRAEVDRAR